MNNLLITLKKREAPQMRCFSLLSVIFTYLTTKRKTSILSLCFATAM